jgi:hypothetical protein
MQPRGEAPMLDEGEDTEEAAMSVMDKLRQMLKGHGERMGEGHDEAGRPAGEKAQDRPAGPADKGPDALRDQFQPPQDNPPQP